jgi:hypothetical protein
MTGKVGRCLVFEGLVRAHLVSAPFLGSSAVFAEEQKS